MLMTTVFTMSDTNGVPYDRLVQGPGAFNAAGALTLAQAINAWSAVGNGAASTREERDVAGLMVVS